MKFLKRNDTSGADPSLSTEDDVEDRVRYRLLRISVLALLTVQNCSLMMVTSYSRSLPGPKYLASTAVVAGELLKTATLVTVLMYQKGICGLQGVIWTEILSRDSQTPKFIIPAFFYTVQNNLWYFAMSNLDSVTAAVTSQLKVLTTAIFSVLILQKKLTHMHWLALCLLVLGLILMQLGTHEGDASGNQEGSYLLGVLAMIAACTSSGFAGVYLERLFKELDSNIWIANLQLQCFCMPIAFLTVLSEYEEMQQSDSLLAGWSGLTVLVVSLNALGGLVVTATMKYADNILKTFAVSMSLVLNCLISWLLLSQEMMPQEVGGVVVVIGGTWLYNLGSTAIMPTKPRSGADGSWEEEKEYVHVKTEMQQLELEDGQPAGEDDSPTPVKYGGSSLGQSEAGG